MKRKTATPEFEYGLKPEECAALRGALATVPRLERAVLFGSRATGTFSPASDVDLALYGEKLTLADQATLAARIEDCNLPVAVDLVRVSTIDSEALRQHIEQQGKLFYQRKTPPTARSLGMASDSHQTRTGGRPATTGVIPGRYALSVGVPDLPAPEGWKWTRLEEVAHLETGHTPSRRHPEYWDGNVPWIGIKDATENHGRVLLDTYQHASQLGIDNSSARVLPSNTVCLSRTASIGYVVVMGRPMATSQDFVNWVCSDAIDYRFLKYVLLAERCSFPRFASGTTHQTIYFPEAKAFSVCLPPKQEQSYIADVLSQLDDKIELNRRMNETLEGMTRAFFQSWFVDFDPVRAKAAVRREHPHWTDAEVCRAALPTLSPEIATLFPDSFENSALGDIPKGWRLETIDNLAEAVGGSTPSTKEQSYWSPEDHSWATPKDLSALKSPVLLQTERKISEVGLRQIGSGLLPAGTVLMSSRAPIGYLAVAETPVAINQGFIAMKPKENVSNLFLLYWAECAQEAIKSRANGSTFLEISKSNFRQIEVVRPTGPLMEKFDSIVRPWYRQVANNERQSSTLAALRDTLLPKLISGEIRLDQKEERD